VSADGRHHHRHQLGCFKLGRPDVATAELLTVQMIMLAQNDACVMEHEHDGWVSWLRIISVSLDNRCRTCYMMGASVAFCNLRFGSLIYTKQACFICQRFITTTVLNWNPLSLLLTTCNVC
jgi:hypothetical protein